MEHTRVDEILKGYRQNKARISSIQAEIQLSTLRIEHLRRNAVNDLILKGKPFVNMPRGSGYGNPVENAALMLVDGYIPEEAMELQQSIEQLQREIKSLELYVLFAEAWLMVLTERERFVIERHIIDGVPWSMLCLDYHKRFDTEYSKDTLKRLQVKALQKIYSVAG